MHRDRALEDAWRYGAQAKTALEVLPVSALRDDLQGLVGYVVERDR